MRAFKARIIYFEKHVWFEHHIRRFAQALVIKTKRKSLSEIIDEISSHKKFKFLKLKASSLQTQKQSRNWLGHMYANANVPIKMIDNFELVDTLNSKIIEATKWVSLDNKLK